MPPRGPHGLLLRLQWGQRQKDVSDPGEKEEDGLRERETANSGTSEAARWEAQGRDGKGLWDGRAGFQSPTEAGSVLGA